MALGGVAIERTAERRDCCGLACTLRSRSRLCVRHRRHRVATTEYSLVILERRPRAAMLDNLKVGGVLFAGAYTAFYARFASQWSYLAGVYNQIMAAQVRGIPTDPAGQNAFDAWQAGFIEDAEELH